MTCTNDLRVCVLEGCQQSFRPMREAQAYCSPRCRNLAKVRRHRSGYISPTHSPIPCNRFSAVLTHPGNSTAPSGSSTAPYFNPHGPTPGALQGDDYPLTYDADGFPELPACLDRRPKPEPEIVLNEPDAEAA